MAITLTEQNFKETIKEGTVVIDFWGDWCAPCHMVENTLEEIAEKFCENLVLAKLNVEDHPDIKEAFGVMTLPTLLLFKEGRYVSRTAGAHPKSVLENWIKNEG